MYNNKSTIIVHINAIRFEYSIGIILLFKYILKTEPLLNFKVYLFIFFNLVYLLSFSSLFICMFISVGIHNICYKKIF